MDKVRIQDDLFHYVNQEKLEELVIPDDMPQIGGFNTLHTEVEKLMIDEFNQMCESNTYPNEYLEPYKEITKIKKSNYSKLLVRKFLIKTVLTLFLYPLTLFYIFYEILSFGFVLAYYGCVFNIGGIIYELIYFLINKALFLLVLIYISIISYKLIKKILKSLINKENISVRELYSNFFKKILICSAFILIADIFVYFFGNKILSLFQFLL